MHPGVPASKCTSQKIPENQVSLARSKIIPINRRAVFAQAASVARKGLLSHTVTEHPLPSSLASRLIRLERNPGAGKSLSAKGEAEEDSSHSHYPLV